MRLTHINKNYIVYLIWVSFEMTSYVATPDEHDKV